MAAQLPRGFNSWAFLRLAFPMIISRTGLAAMGIADGIMVSRFSPHEFAWLSLAEGTLGRLLDIFIAFLIGGLSLVPRHSAQGDSAGARMLWQRTIPVSVALGLTGLLVGLAGKSVLAMFGQEPQLVLGGAPVMAILGAGYSAALLAISAAVYLEGMNRPHLVAVSVVTANVLNIALNWVLIGGHLGVAAMGARGSALSTTIVRSGLCLALFGLAWRLRAAQPQVNKTKTQSEDLAASLRAQWRLGLGAAGTLAAMVALTAPLTVFAGWLGVLPLATFAAAWSIGAPAGLLGLGMADAAGIYVAAEAGRAGERNAAAVAWASLRITIAPLAAIACCLTIWASIFAALYTKDDKMRIAMTAVIPVVALVLLVDCSGFVMAASLRAIREVKWPAGIEIGSMLVVIPLALSLTFLWGYGVKGLFIAMLVPGMMRAAMLALRFRWRTYSAASHPDAPVREWSLNAE